MQRLILVIAFLSFGTFFFTGMSSVHGAGQFQRKANCDVCGYCDGAEAPSNWEKCRDCLYPQIKGGPASGNTLTSPEGIPTPDPYHYYTDLSCLSTRPGEFAAQTSSFFFSIVGGIAFLYFLYGSFMIATSRASPDKLNQGKRIIYGSIIGLLFALASVFIIRIIANSLGVPGLD